MEEKNEEGFDCRRFDVPKEVLEGAREVGKIREAFRKMLERYIPQVGYFAPERPRILDLGCEECCEAYVLSGYFGGKPDGFESEDVLVVGIDIDKEKIEKARMDYSKFDLRSGKWVERPNYRFICGDARQLRQLVDDEFDIVVARHPNIAEIPDTWYEIFKESFEMMKPKGLFLATSYSDIEHEILKKQVQKADYKIVLSTQNAYAIPTSHEECSIDRNVLFARK